jgi:hypothetical protein
MFAMKRIAQFFTVLAMWAMIQVVLPLNAAAQCPMCKAAVESNSGYGEGESWLASMLNTGIIYLFTLPYLAIMGVGFLWYRGYKRKQREEAMEEMTTIESVTGLQPGSDHESPI